MHMRGGGKKELDAWGSGEKEDQYLGSPIVFQSWQGFVSGAKKKKKERKSRKTNTRLGSRLKKNKGEGETNGGLDDCSQKRGASHIIFNRTSYVISMETNATGRKKASNPGGSRGKGGTVSKR